MASKIAHFMVHLLNICHSFDFYSAVNLISVSRLIWRHDIHWGDLLIASLPGRMQVDVWSWVWLQCC